jgi:hypothetical protein
MKFVINMTQTTDTHALFNPFRTSGYKCAAFCILKSALNDSWPVIPEKLQLLS